MDKVYRDCSELFLTTGSESTISSIKISMKKKIQPQCSDTPISMKSNHWPPNGEENKSNL